MKISLTKKESEEYFYNALCNAVGTGYMNSYGIEMDFNSDDYKSAKTKLKSPCFEDVLMQILRDGKQLILTDIEGEGENTKSINLTDVHERVCKMPVNHLMDMIEQNDDAITADVLIQTVFYSEIIFG